MLKQKITIEVKVTVDMIDNIMVGALEGGIHDWCSGVSVTKESTKTLAEVGVDHDQYLKENYGIDLKRSTKALVTGGEVSFYDYEEDKWYPMTLDDLTKGMKMWMLYTSRLITEEEWGNMDASDFDMVIQFALFNEVVYS